VVVADECQGYIGETDGYSILLAAKASSCKIVALSATPQLHAPERLKELEKIFDRIHVFSIEDPEINKHVPQRAITTVRVRTPEPLLRVYHALGTLVNSINFKIRKSFGNTHTYSFCKKHFLCKKKIALQMLRYRLVEDGASSVLGYTTWKFPELRKKKEELDGKSIYMLYQEALKHTFNHKIFSCLNLLRQRTFRKIIIYVESVVAAKQMAAMLHKEYGMDRVAVLVGKSSMNMDQQASALLQFKEKADILVCTSIGEEGLDIPSADVEIWLDPPSNPKKWIQRFGRILRQPGDKEVARVYALTSMRTHEKEKFLTVKKKTEKIYKFTQELKSTTMPFIAKSQRTLLEYNSD
jgi:ERCC4-related helicase